jgi:N-acetylmuramic acid 6-phosphate (MurNAc-6-P) etherase
VGQIDAGVSSLGKIKKAITSTLNQLKYTGPGSSGILSSWDAKSLVLTYDGATQTVAITVSVVFVGQNRFITIYTNVQPLNASV